MLRRVLSQVAWAAIAAKGSEPQRRYRRWLSQHFDPSRAAWAVAHYILRVIWHMLHKPPLIDLQTALPSMKPPFSEKRSA